MAMPEPIKPSGKSQEDEIQRLRAQVSELQSELSRRPVRASSSTTGAEDSDEYDDGVGDDDFEGRTSDMLNQTSDAMRELPARAMDEASKLIRGLTFAYLEHLRGAASVLDTFTSEVYALNQPAGGGGRSSQERDDGRSRPRRDADTDRYETRSHSAGRGQRRGSSRGRRTVTGLTADLPRHLHSGVIQALHHATTIPSRVVDQFHASYRESDDAEPSTPVRGGRRFDRDSDTESGAQEHAERAKREASSAVRQAARSTLEAAKPNP
jgi:hypothetical protein